MTSAPSLGPIVFNSFEVPERISFGGSQKLVVHAMPGGRRVIDAMGPEEAPIRWSGVFSGQSAASRVRIVERLRRSGTQALLSWDSWRFTVIVREFEVEMTNSWWIPYRLELCVAPSLGELVVDWLSSAVTPYVPETVIDAVGLQKGIETASAGLTGTDLGSVVSAAGQLAKYVTVRAYQAAS